MFTPRAAAVGEVHVEAVVAQAQHREPVVRELDLVLDVDRGNRGTAVVGVVGHGRRERHRHRHVRVVRRHEEREVGPVEEPGHAQVVGGLFAELHAHQELVADRAGLRRERQVGLVEEVLAQLLVVVGGERDEGRWPDRPRRRRRRSGRTCRSRRTRVRLRRCTSSLNAWSIVIEPWFTVAAVGLWSGSPKKVDSLVRNGRSTSDGAASDGMPRSAMRS